MEPDSRAASSERERVLTLWLYEEGPFPNNPRLPALVYHRAFDLEGVDGAGLIERTFARNGWRNGWRNGVYPFHHYHSTAHEVLGCYRGQAGVQLGGPGGPLVTIVRGDVLVIPAGVAHRSEGASADFAVVGCYAGGRQWDMQFGDAGSSASEAARIAAVPPPDADPVHGREGPLTLHWKVW